MREFPANAVMERRMLSAAKESDSCWSLLTKEGEHRSSSNVFVCVLPVLKFAVDIILSLVSFFLQFIFDCSKKCFF